MVESAARRDRIDSQAVSGWYLWEAPKKPACVYLSFELIDKLEREVVENFRSLTSRGSEVGGILLGAIAPGVPAGISVEDFEAVACDYSRGPLYRLSDADLGRFERAMEERSAASNLQVVGFFRSHTRKGLALDAEDLAFLEARFRNPHAMALLVRPFATKASVGGIFLREDGGFNSEASALEFPFRSSQLTPCKRPPEPATPTPAPTRAQVVPIATRREISTPPAVPPTPVSAPEPVVEALKPVPVPEPKAVSLAASVTPPPAPPAQAETPKPAPATQAAAPSPVAPKPAPAPAKNAAPATKGAPAPAPAAKVKESTPVPAPAPKADAPKPEVKKLEAVETAEPDVANRGSKVPMLTGLLAAVLLVLVLLFVYPGFLHHSQRPSTAVNQDSSPLTLRVEHTGTDLLLTWNRDSAAIRNAARASLSISDGDRHENYDMDLAQLKTGSIVYSPLGGDVSFQMEVTGKDQSRTATETLRLLQTRPSPMPAEGQDPKTAKNGNPAQPLANAQNSVPSTVSPDPKTGDGTPADDPKQPSTPVKPFDASSLGQRLRPARTADLADVPSPVTGSPVTPKVSADPSMPFTSLPAAPAAPPVATPAPAPVRVAAPPPPAPAAQKKGSDAGGQIQAAQLISRKEPEYPLLARQMGAKGTVELIATIGADGSVKAVKVVKGHPLLVKAAQDAVMQWRYRPTLLNGVAVQNDTRITLNFVAQQ